MDLTLFLFDSRLRVRAILTMGIVSCVHKERSHALNAEIPGRHRARPGEYIGLRCIDGKFRAFCIEYADDDDETGTTIITATDAAVDELQGTIIARPEKEEIAYKTMAQEIAAAAGFALRKNDASDKKVAEKAATLSAWKAIGEIEAADNLYASAYYDFDGEKITGRVLELVKKEPIYRGRLVESESGAQGIVISHRSRPRPKIYPIGADGLTIADAVWSTANGDPTDKPQGQTWIGVQEAVTAYMGRGQVLDCQDVTDKEELIRRGWEKAQEETAPAVTATATISDMEMIAGQTYKMIRLFDLVAVRMRSGETAQEQVVDIDRNYVEPEATKITLGKEPDTSAKRIKALSKRTDDAEGTLKRHGAGIAKNQTELHDTQVTVKELGEYTNTTFSDVFIKLNAAEAEILLRATKEEVTENDTYYRTQISDAFARIDAADAEILLKASVETVKGLEKEIDDAYIRIGAAEKEIELKADKILLNGYVKAKAFKAEIAKIDKFFSGKSTIAKAIITNLTALSAEIGSMTFNKMKCRWSYISIPTGGRIPALTGYNVRLGDGSTAVIYAFKSESRGISLDTESRTLMEATT